MSQTDFKKLVAYSSVSHMGFVTLGAAMMTDAAVNGALFMMIAHGITSAMMFFVVGVIYERAHHRVLDRFGGLATTIILGVNAIGAALPNEALATRGQPFLQGGGAAEPRPLAAPDVIRHRRLLSENAFGPFARFGSAAGFGTK